MKPNYLKYLFSNFDRVDFFLKLLAIISALLFASGLLYSAIDTNVGGCLLAGGLVCLFSPLFVIIGDEFVDWVREKRDNYRAWLRSSQTSNDKATEKAQP